MCQRRIIPQSQAGEKPQKKRLASYIMDRFRPPRVVFIGKVNQIYVTVTSVMSQSPVEYVMGIFNGLSADSAYPGRGLGKRYAAHFLSPGAVGIITSPSCRGGGGLPMPSFALWLSSIRGRSLDNACRDPCREGHKWNMRVYI